MVLSGLWLWAAASAQTEGLLVTAEPIGLEASASTRTQVGPLTFLSGFVLRSEDRRFGGLSGLALSADGQVLYAISDHGFWLSSPLRHTPDGRLSGFGPWTITRLLDPRGKPLRQKMSDAEALVREADGAFAVAFEGRPRLWRYPAATPPLTMPPQAIGLPPEAAAAPNNGGLEAVTRLVDGRWLLLTETFENTNGSLKGWIGQEGAWATLSYQQGQGFRPTDLAALSNGDVLVLERFFSLFTGPAARLRWLSRDQLRAGALLKGRELARLEPPLTVDNFEGLAVYQTSPDDLVLYLVSDDNYRTLQRTLLLQFRLDLAALSPRPPKPDMPAMR